MQSRNGNLIIADLVRSIIHARHTGTTTGNVGPRRRLGGHPTQEDGSDRRRWSHQPAVKDTSKPRRLGRVWQTPQ
jgi:hypothetical protein